MRIDLLPTNDRHHLATLLKVGEGLREQGHTCRFLSLAEWRGLETPLDRIQTRGFDAIRVVPPLRRYARWVRQKALKAALPVKRRSRASSARSSAPRSFKGQNTKAKLKRTLESAVAHRIGNLVARHQTDIVVLMNDAAPPGDAIAHRLTRQGTPFVLLQEGIRFPLPTEDQAYGAFGADLLCAWGDASAEHFRKVTQPKTEVIATGTPRFPAWAPSPCRAKTGPVQHIGLFTNPIDDQGFVSTAEKMDGFERLLKAMLELRRGGTPLRATLRHHGGESRTQYAQSIGLAGAEDLCTISDAPLPDVLADVDAGVIFASSVGLEVLMAERPLGVLETPGHGFVHDFVSLGAAVPLAHADLESGLRTLIADPNASAAARENYIRRHLTFGDPASTIADAIERIGKESRTSR